MERHILPEAAHKAGDELSGFVIDAVTPVDDVKVLCYECRHLATGARLVHLHCHDIDNMYAISFRTPLTDSTGVAHILEHSVLSGSKKFPLREIFSELSKTSMNTYLNAGTYADKTVYPVCSAVRADFWNLAEVYTDTTLNPLLTKGTFMREGHHLEFEKDGDMESPLVVSGVVYNEMKGAMASPERQAYQVARSGLYPDTSYAYNSGGDPECIPDLRYEDFLAYHKRFYNPSNATWFLYGDIPLAEHLSFVGERLRGFSRGSADTAVREQPVWTAPRTVRGSYTIASDEPTAARTYVGVSWLVAHLKDVEETLLLQVLGEAILGNAGGPLRKALVDSGLGQDLIEGGHSGHKQQGTFIFLLRGSEADRAERAETLALETLRHLADTGLDPDLVEAAFHRIEFGSREIRNSFAPDQLLDRMAELGNYGIDVKNALLYGSLLAAARKRYLAEPTLFQDLIRRWLLDNPHRQLCVVTPSATLAAEKEAAFKARMAELKGSMTKADLERVRAESEELKAAQDRPETPQALASVPRLSIADVPRDKPVFPSQIATGGFTALSHPVFSNGILAVDLAFDASDLSADELLLLPFFARATLNCGVPGFDYAAMATRIARSTGGLGFGASALERRAASAGPASSATYLVLRGSALERNIPELFTIFRDLTLGADYADAKRIKDLAHESYNELKSSLSRSGSSYAYLSAASALSQAGLRNEQLRGFTQVRKLRELVRLCESDAASLAAPLRAMAAKLFSSGRLTVNLTGEPRLVDEAQERASRFAACLPDEKPKAAALAPFNQGPSLGIAVQTSVNFVSRVLKTAAIGHPAAPALELLSFIASNDYMNKKLRLQGGAYGGYTGYDALDGTFSLGSYRDPRLAATLADFDGLVAYLRSPEFNAAAVESSRIGVIGQYDYIQAPKSAGYSSLFYYLRGLDQGQRDAFRSGLFTVTLEDIRRTAIPLIEEAYAASPKAVVGSRDAIEKANAELLKTGAGKPFEIVSLED